MNDEIKQLRALLCKSQDEFARDLGVSVDSVRKWEQGKSTPGKRAQVKLAVVAKQIATLAERIRERQANGL